MADIVTTLGAHDVKYLLIGGVAAQLHGAPIPRTSAAEVCVMRSPENLDRLAAALRSMGARLRVGDGPPGGVEIPLDRRTFGRHVTITFVTNYGPFDVCFTPDGTTGYRDLSRNTVAIEVLGVEAPVASLEDVVRSKRAAGREKDLRVLPALVRYLRSRGDGRS